MIFLPLSCTNLYMPHAYLYTKALDAHNLIKVRSTQRIRESSPFPLNFSNCIHVHAHLPV